MTPSTDVIQLTLTLKMTTPQVVETSVTVNKNSPIQDYVHPDNQTQPNFVLCRYVSPIHALLCSNSLFLSLNASLAPSWGGIFRDVTIIG